MSLKSSRLIYMCVCVSVRVFADKLHRCTHADTNPYIFISHSLQYLIMTCECDRRKRWDACGRQLLPSHIFLGALPLHLRFYVWIVIRRPSPSDCMLYISMSIAGRWWFFCTCVCVFLYLLHTEDRNLHPTVKVRTFYWERGHFSWFVQFERGVYSRVE